MKTFFHRKLFYLTLVFLPVQLGYHFWPEWASVLGRRVDYLSPTLYFTDLLIVATLVSWVISERIKLKQSSITPLLAAGIFMVFITTVFSKNISVSFYQCIKIIEFFLFGLYIVLTKPKFEHVVTAFSIAVLYSSVIALIQFIMQKSIGGPLWILGERTFFADTSGIAQFNLCVFTGNACRLILRPYATFPHPNVLGGFLAITLPYLFIFLTDMKKETSGKISALLCISIIFGVCALIVSFSRSAWFAGLCGFVFCIHTILVKHFFFYRKHLKKFIPGIVVFVLFIGYFFIRNLMWTESVIVRNQLNMAAINIFLAHPFTGVGWGNFMTALPSYMSTRTIYFLQPVHSLYLLALSQIGLVGVLYLSFCVVFFVTHVKRIVPVYGLSIVTILLIGFVDHYFFTLQQGQLLFTLCVGIFLATSKQKENFHTL